MVKKANFNPHHGDFAEGPIRWDIVSSTDADRFYSMPFDEFYHGYIPPPPGDLKKDNRFDSMVRVASVYNAINQMIADYSPRIPNYLLVRVDAHSRLDDKLTAHSDTLKDALPKIRELPDYLQQDYADRRIYHILANHSIDQRTRYYSWEPSVKERIGARAANNSIFATTLTWVYLMLDLLELGEMGYIKLTKVEQEVFEREGHNFYEWLEADTRKIRGLIM